MSDIGGQQGAANSESDKKDSTNEASIDSSLVKTQELDPRISNAANDIVKDHQEKPSIKAPKTYQGEINTEKEILDRVKTSERWMIWLTAVVAFTAIFQTVQSCNNNASTSKQVDKVICAANRIGEAADKFSTSAANINTGIGKAVDKLGDQAGATNDLGKQAGIQASAATQSVAILKRQFIADHRPYVSIFKTEFTGSTTANDIQPISGQPLSVDLNYVNNGKGPALNFRIQRYLVFGKSGIDRFNAIRHYPNTVTKGTVLTVGVPAFSTAKALKNPDEEAQFVTESDLQTWDGTRPIILFGTFYYDDAYGNSYCNDFSAYWLHDKVWADAGSHAVHTCEEKKAK